MRFCDDIHWCGGLLGLLLAAAGLVRLVDWKPVEVHLEPARRLGYARPIATLAGQEQIGEGKLSWLASFRRALRIQLSTADRLRIEPPLEDELVLLETDVLPAAWYRLSPATESLWELRVQPWQGEAWSAPSGSGGPVRPAAYPPNGRLAYYDLGRIWISDLHGMRMQSLQHVPLLEQGGELYWDYAGTRLCWMGSSSNTAAAVELGVLSGPAAARSVGR